MSCSKVSYPRANGKFQSRALYKEAVSDFALSYFVLRSMLEYFLGNLYGLKES